MNKPHTKETKEKISLACKGRKAWNKGKKFSLESRKKMSESQKLLWKDPEYKNKMLDAHKDCYTKEVREKMSEAQKGKKQSPETIKKRFEARKGYRHSEETKQKIGIGNKGKARRPISDETREKLCIAYKKRLKNKKHHWNYKTGQYKENGYILVKAPSHPNRKKNGYIRKHRLVVEAQIGRLLWPAESIHHINKTRDDNRPENLIAFCSNSAHVSFEKWDKVNPADIIFDGRKI